MQVSSSVRLLEQDHETILHRILAVRGLGPDPGPSLLRAVWEPFIHLERDLLPHLDEEEAVLVPILGGIADGGEAMAARIEADHRLIRQNFRALLGAREPDLGALRAAADLLGRHILWEENTVFPALAEHLPSESLAAIEGRSKEFRRRRRGSQALVTRATMDTFRDLIKNYR